MVTIVDKLSAHRPRHPEKAHKPDNPVQRKKPDWLRVKAPVSLKYQETRKLVREHKLVTVCEEAQCPNRWECWGHGTATFMILGNVCTRSCSFCAVATGRPSELDEDEPRRVAEHFDRLMAERVLVVPT